METRYDIPRTINSAGFLFAIINLVGDGFQTILNKLRPTGMSNLFFAWATSVVELAVLFPLFLRDRANKGNREHNNTDPIPSFTRKDIASIAVAGIIFSFCTYYLIVGYCLTDSVTGIVAVKTQPLSTLVVGAIVLKERLSKKEIAIGLTMLVLLAYLVTGGTFQLASVSYGVIILIIVPACWAVGHSIAKPFLNKRMLTPIEFVFIRIGFTTTILGVIFAFAGNTAEIGYFTWIPALVPIIAFGLLFALLHTSWYQAVKALPLTIATFVVLPSPVVTAVLTLFTTHEALYPFHYIGIGGEILLLAILIWVQTKKRALITPKVVEMS